MSKKKKSTVSKKRPVQKKQKANIGLIVLVVILAGAIILWGILSARQPAEVAAPTENAAVAAATETVGSPENTAPTKTTLPLPELIGTKQYASAPPMLIDPARRYTATVTMAKGGEFVIELYADKAPITVNSFVFLARQGYFDGVTFHRVLEGFMAQGGDPTGTGMGGPGYEFKNEDSNLTFKTAGVVAMANAGRDTNGSQFFITFAPAEFLNGGYTIFGQVISGMDVVNSITRRDPDTNPTFQGDAIKTITITEE
jgi:cyclophilin family peptidyl-prolyl cis-trans isomerase